MQRISIRAIAFLLVLVPACMPPTTPDNAVVVRAYAEKRSTIQVTAQGAVTRVLEDDSGPPAVHQRFIIRLAGSTQTVLVENNVTIGQRAPVLQGNDVLVHGEYVWNDQGGLIHFTHHDPAHSHEGGWIEVGGVRYQ